MPSHYNAGTTLGSRYSGANAASLLHNAPLIPAGSQHNKRSLPGHATLPQPIRQPKLNSPAKRQLHLARTVEPVQQPQGSERDLPVARLVPWLSHRVVVRKRDEGDPGRRDVSFHRERHRRDPRLLYGPAHQSHGPVAEGSGRRKERNVHPVARELPRDLGGSFIYERGRVVDGAHKREVPAV